MEVLRLKELLKEKGISGKELASMVGVSENSISFIATGKTQPRFELLIDIAKSLDVDIKELFNSTKDSDQSPKELLNEIRRSLDQLENRL